MMTDPAETYASAPWIGGLSNLGAMLWAAAAGVWWLGYAALRQRPVADRGIVRVQLSCALAGTLLGLDDMFMFHDDWIPFHTNISEHAVLAAYGVLAIV